MTFALSGNSVTTGIAIGHAHLLVQDELDIREYTLAADAIDEEIARFRRAREAARDHLQILEARIADSAGRSAAEILETHIHMLEDSMLSDATEQRIRQRAINAEWALQLQLQHVLDEFEQMEDEYIRARAEDVRQVTSLIQQFLNPDQEETEELPIPEQMQRVIVVARDLTPGEIASLNERQVAGLITEKGSPYSHSAILARSLRIPTMTGVGAARSWIREGENLVLDGHYGVVFIQSEDNVRRHYHAKQRDSRRYRDNLATLAGEPAVSRDNITIRLTINAERAQDIETGRQAGVDGIGLYRTEYLFLGDANPDEETQLQAYREAIAAMDGLPVTIRTLDLGADKPDGVAHFEAGLESVNPALGLRALRLCLRNTKTFKAQLRAILRASASGPTRLMVPMLTSVQEMRALHGLLDECRAELERAGLAFDPSMPVGGMIEVPGAALAIDTLLPQLDFLSVGTNDLIQYTLAIDRVDDKVSYLFEPTHPAVLSLLQRVFDRAHRASCPAAVCGEMAGDPRYTRLLLALGLREFSMHPGNVLEVKQSIRDTDIGRARATLTRLLAREQHLPPQTLLQQLDASQIGQR